MTQKAWEFIIGGIIMVLVVIASFSMFPKLYEPIKPFLAWTGIVKYGPIDENYISLTKTEPKTIVMALDPNDWKSGGETIDCKEKKTAISFSFDRRFSESAKINPSSIFSIYQSIQCKKDVNKKTDYSGPIMPGSSAEGDFFVLIEDRKMDTWVTISNIECCESGKRPYLIKMNLDDEISSEGKKINPSTAVVKFITD